MIAGQSVLALVPARGGSKRLPGKNLRLLGGKPLIAWTLDLARQVEGIDDLLVSTDDEAIAQAARGRGARVPWLRPAELATDTSPSSDAIAHALRQCEAEGRRPDLVLLLQPTSPFRDAAQVRAAVERCVALDGAPVVAFAPAQSNPAWCFSLDAEGRAQPVLAQGDGTARRSQDLAEVYEISGSLYVCSTERWLRTRSFFTPETRAQVIRERHLALDIDDAFDWLVAEAVVAAGWVRP